MLKLIPIVQRVSISNPCCSLYAKGNLCVCKDYTVDFIDGFGRYVAVVDSGFMLPPKFVDESDLIDEDPDE